MPLVYRDQAPGTSGFDLNGATFDLATTPGSVIVGGAAVMPTGSFPLAGTFVLAAGLTLFIKADGTLTDTWDANCLATLAWYDGTDLIAIRHT